VIYFYSFALENQTKRGKMKVKRLAWVIALVIFLFSSCSPVLAKGPNYVTFEVVLPNCQAVGGANAWLVKPDYLLGNPFDNIINTRFNSDVIAQTFSDASGKGNVPVWQNSEGLVWVIEYVDSQGNLWVGYCLPNQKAVLEKLFKDSHPLLSNLKYPLTGEKPVLNNLKVKTVFSDGCGPWGIPSSLEIYSPLEITQGRLVVVVYDNFGLWQSATYGRKNFCEICLGNFNDRSTYFQVFNIDPGFGNSRDRVLSSSEVLPLSEIVYSFESYFWSESE
jgi:hypothetical protein